MPKICALAGAAFLCCALLTGCPAKEEEGGDAPARERSAVKVLLTTVEADTLRETVEGIGTLRALEQVELRPEVGGLIRAIHFEEGATVEKGQKLFTIDDDKLQRQLNARQAALELAQAQRNLAVKTHERVATLRERGSVTPEEFDQTYARLQEAGAEVNRLEAEVELIREQLADTEILTPFAGTIGEQHVDVGDFVTVGQLLAMLYRMDLLEIAFGVPERFLGRITVGQPVDARVVAYPDRNFEGEVTYISPAVDEATRDFLVKSRIDNAEALLRPGAFARAVITLEVREARPVVPEEALVSTRTGYLVFAVTDDTAHARDVQIGLREPGIVEIRDGLEVGEMVVRKGHMNLSDGVPVAPVEDPQAAAEAPTETSLQNQAE